jgi:hypothetical protein
MKLERITYRVSQFREAIWAAPEPTDLELAQTYLNPAQMELFARMHASEQAHSLRVFKQLLNEPLEDENNHDLLVAALLHDVGKSCHPLALWERAVVVLIKRMFPRQSTRWGAVTPADDDVERSNWRRPFIIAEQHPGWGAEMAAAVGSSPLATALILRHQTILSADAVTLEDRLLKRLQAADSAC